MSIIISKAIQAEHRRFIRCAYQIDWRNPLSSDLKTFQRYPDAEYFLRSWHPSDDPDAFEDALASGKTLVTIVFRAGCLAVRSYRPGQSDPLMQTCWFGEDVISEFPELAGEAL